jgi:hypothetical protein
MQKKRYNLNNFYHCHFLFCSLFKYSLLLCSLLLCSLLLCSCSSIASSKEIRFRILSDDSTIESQEEKQIVKQIVQELGLKDYETYLEKPSLLETKIREKLPNTFTKTIQVDYTSSFFEAKSYDNKLYPSGYYPTLLVKIGEGKGKNFWTLLYPTYFDASFEEDHEVEYRSFFYDWWTKEKAG